MPRSTEPQFDHYARSYRDLHRDSIRGSGEEPDYFAAYKVAYMARQLADVAATEALSILDFGCGIGNSIPHIARMFPRSALHGCDVSGESVEMAKAANPEVHFEVLGSTGLSLPDASIDVAMAACVFHHIPPAERAFWTRELRRVVKPTGHLFIFEHNPANPLTQKVVRDCPFDDDAILLSRSESEALLRDAGFARVEVDYIVFFPRFLAFLRPLERLLVRLPLGAQYVAQGQVR